MSGDREDDGVSLAVRRHDLGLDDKLLSVEKAADCLQTRYGTLGALARMWETAKAAHDRGDRCALGKYAWLLDALVQQQQNSP